MDGNDQQNTPLPTPDGEPRLYFPPPRPEFFVARPAEYDQIKALLIGGQPSGAVAITTALHGAGGLGKTTLAQALFHDPEIQRHFRDGLIWVTLGKTPDVALEARRICGLLTGDPDARDADTKLKTWLRGKSFLFVIDDVWKIADLRPFLTLARESGAQCLFTTRNIDIAGESGGKCVPVDRMKPDEALQTLTRGVNYGPEHEADLRKLADRLGEWPLLLKLAGGMLRQRLRRKEPLERALEALNRRLEDQGVVAFDVDPTRREKAIEKTIDLSLEELPTDNRERYWSLAVFPEDTDVPISAAGVLWGIPESYAEKTLLEMDALALLTLDLSQQIFSQHDIFRDYVIHRTADLPGLHRCLIEAYYIRNGETWAEGSDDGYFFGHLIYHMLLANKVNEARSLLLDYDWIQARLEAADKNGTIDINATVGDYDLWLKAEGATETEIVDDITFAPRMVRDALLKVSHVLTGARTKITDQLPAQLAGRLMLFKDADLIRLRKQAERPIHPPPWIIIPKTASLIQAGRPLIRTLEGHTREVKSVAVFERGEIPMAISASADCTLRLWNLQTGQVEGDPLTGHTRIVNAVAVFERDGVPMAISASHDRTLRLWNLEIGRTEGTMQIGLFSHISSLAIFERDGIPMAIMTSGDRNLQLWNLQTMRHDGPTLKGHTGCVNSLAVYKRDGIPMAITASSDRTLRLWNLKIGQPEGKPLKGHTDVVRVVKAFECDGTSMAISASADGTLMLWDLQKGRLEGVTMGHHAEWVNAMTVCVHADIPIAILALDDETIGLWNLKTNRQEGEPLKGHTGGVLDIATFDHNGTTMAISASEDQTLRLWKLQNNLSDEAMLKGHTSRVNFMTVFERRGVPMVISASDDETIRLWNLKTFRPEGEPLEGHTNQVFGVATFVQGRFIQAISTSGDRTLRLWDLQSSRFDGTVLKGHTDEVKAVAIFSHDGFTMAVSASSDHTLRLWNLETGQPEGRPLKGHNGSVNSVAVFKRNGSNMAVSGSGDRTLRLWNLETCQPEGQPMEGHTDWVKSVAVFIRVGIPMAISASDDKTLRLWNLKTGRPDGEPMRGHTDWVSSVATFELGGIPMAISASDDKTLRLWNLEKRECLATFTGERPLSSVTVVPEAFSDEHIIVVSESSGRIHFLRLIESEHILNEGKENNKLLSQVKMKNIDSPTLGKPKIGARNMGMDVDQVNFGIITVREDEFLAIINRFSGRFSISKNNHHYEIVRLVNDQGRECKIAIVRCPEQGNAVAQSVTQNLIQDLNPVCLILSGIAGGIPDTEYSLGDVLLAIRLYDYSIRAMLKNGQVQYSSAGGPMHPWVQSLLGNMPAFLERELKGWNTEEAIRCEIPEIKIPQRPSGKCFYGDLNWKKKVLECLESKFRSKRNPRHPIAKGVAVANADMLVKNADEIKKWLESARAIKHVEMELAGVYQAAFDKQIPLLSVRGLSDIVGYKRSPEWTEYACHTAAAFTYALIRSGITQDLTQKGAEMKAEGQDGTQKDSLAQSIHQHQEGGNQSPVIGQAGTVNIHYHNQGDPKNPR